MPRYESKKNELIVDIKNIKKDVIKKKLTDNKPNTFLTLLIKIAVNLLKLIFLK
jgi:hypothetical protein